MSVDFGSTGNLNIAGTTYMSIDTAGRVLKPNQTAFYAHSGNGVAAGSDIVFGGVSFNIGSAYNASNGRFTCPIFGRYFFRFQQLAPNANAGEYRHALYANGAGWGGSRFIMVKPASSWWSVIAEGHMILSAGDYVTVRFESGPGAMYTDGNFSSFSGHLIG
jgi:hypothetical protein